MISAKVQKNQATKRKYEEVTQNTITNAQEEHKHLEKMMKQNDQNNNLIQDGISITYRSPQDKKTEEKKEINLSDSEPVKEENSKTI